MSPRVVTFILLINGIYSAPLKCPANEAEWVERSKIFSCQGEDVYHCFLMEDELSRKEKCIEKTTLVAGFCPAFTNTGYIFWKACNITGCPNSTYHSDQVYKCSNVEENNELINYTADIEEDEETNEFVAGGVNVLTSKNLLCLFGKLGNSLSTTGKDIVKAFAQTHNIDPYYYNYLDIPNDFPPETVNFIDGWCGLWNTNPSEMQITIKNLEQIISCCETVPFNIKFVLGIRTEIKEDLENHKINFNDNETLLLDTFSKFRQRKVAQKLESIKANCCNNTCKCKSLALRNIENISCKHTGIPLIVNLMDIDHSMIEQFLIKDTSPLKAMKKHIHDIKSNDTELFQCLLYLVNNGYYDQHDFKEEVAREFNVAQTCFENNKKVQKYTKSIKKSELTPMWAANISNGNVAKNVEGASCQTVRVFWHNFLYICAFHVCFDAHPEKMIRFCNMDALLQLLRPTTSKQEPFTVAVNTALIKIFCERIQGTPLEEKLSEHPLMMSPKWKRTREKRSAIRKTAIF
ncbi:uncharacterized protein LOC133197963 isoform X2 [Saccostrea echinata]|uniref:uncharacterized protein LOC133197963 isoform X2 n=1 Tax=Saccostrea echinata TaxID=191078 RepID=UPI002A7FC306|nr:uncharacterized protein LOC133197963 isoform X2 [Saccostrea echinata]